MVVYLKYTFQQNKLNMHRYQINLYKNSHNIFHLLVNFLLVVLEHIPHNRPLVQKSHYTHYLSLRIGVLIGYRVH